MSQGEVQQPVQCVKHDFILAKHDEYITKLFAKYEQMAEVVAALPEKVDSQTEILRGVKDALSVLPEHQKQLAVICEVLADYRETKREQREDHNKLSQIDLEQLREDHDKLLKFNPEQAKADHDKVTKMDAEWSLVKWQIPIAITVINIAIGIFFNLRK